jgi:hypothetical protein
VLRRAPPVGRRADRTLAPREAVLDRVVDREAHALVVRWNGT